MQSFDRACTGFMGNDLDSLVFDSGRTYLARESGPLTNRCVLADALTS